MPTVTAGMTPDELKHLRQELGLTQERFAQRVQFSAGTISCYERGTMVISEGRALLIKERLSAKKKTRTGKRER